MPPNKAQEIAHGLKWLTRSYAVAGLVRDAARAERGQPVVDDLRDLVGANATG